MAGTNDSLTFSSRLAEDDPASRYWRPLLTDPNGDFARNYNRESFCFDHGLKGHPLFELDSLIALSHRLPVHADFAYWSNGGVDVTDPWEKGMFKRPSLPETVSDILVNDSILIMKHTEQDSIHGPVLRKLLSTFVEFVGAKFRDDVILGEAMILVASPNRITPYHFDAELNFLLQIKGDKTLNVFDHTRAKQVSAEELEGYFSGYPSSAKYSEARQAHATVYDFRAGQGVHIPCMAPHWVQNGNSLSVALSVNYQLKSVKRIARSHWLNHRLRKLGLVPASPGSSRVRDAVKGWSADQLQALRRMTKPKPPTPPWSDWKPD